MRCITAIWPAGPPKLKAATRNHVQKASANVTPWLGRSAARGDARVTDTSMSISGLARWPIVGFLRRVTTPTVHGVVETHSRLELLEVLAIHARVSKRYSKQTGRLWGELQPGRVGATHDGRQPRQRLGFEREFLEHGIERTGGAAMAPEDTIDVEWRGVEAFCDGRDFRRQHEQKHRLGVDKAAYQPWTSDAVDLWPAPRHPYGAALVIARRQLIGANQDFVGSSPRFKAAFERLRIDALVPQPGGCPFAQFLPTLADDNNAPTPILGGPIADRTVIAPPGTWH